MKRFIGTGPIRAAVLQFYASRKSNKTNTVYRESKVHATLGESHDSQKHAFFQEYPSMNLGNVVLSGAGMMHLRHRIVENEQPACSSKGTKKHASPALPL